MQLMAPWVPAFKSALDRHLESAPFVTLSFATVDDQGCPRVRTCIYRGFLFGDRKTNVLTITTDTRMEKFTHLAQNPQFEACFWFPGTNEQFRVSGKAHAITEDTLDKVNDLVDYPIVSPHTIKHYSSSLDLTSMGGGAHNNTASHKPTPEEWREEFDDKWNSLSTKLKSSFRKPEPGSLLTPEKQNLIDSISRGVDGSNEEEGKKHYSLVLLLVDKVDYVNLNAGHHEIRYKYERYDNDQWTEDEVCP